jgi:hypothetical protein
MPDFKEMYLKLFRSQTTAINILKEAQKETEEMYIEAEPPKLTLFPTDEPEEDK